MSVMTYLVASIVATTPQEATADLDRALADGATAVELRVDHLADCDDIMIRSIAAARPESIPLILTIRSADEGGAWDADDQQRLARLIALGPAFDCIDVELATYDRSANIRQKVGLALGGSGEPRRRLILSAHDFAGRPAKLTAMLARMLEHERVDVVKLAWRARTVRDNFEAFELMREAAAPVVAICMGDAGLPSRVLARKFGAFATYASVTADRAAAPGQLTVQELRQLYRWDRISASTKVFGVVGWPVEHSLSPHVHNAAFDRTGFDGVYLPLPIEPFYESFKAFVVEALARPWFDLAGLSVTVPHKQHALRLARELNGTIDPACERVGAANTLRFSREGRIKAINTDLPAAVDSIAVLLGMPEGKLEGRSCLVLGAGGVARAVVAGLRSAGATVTIAARSSEKSAALAVEFGADVVEWQARSARGFDLVVNATPVGMWPETDATPLPADRLAPPTAVFDTVYAPAQTALLASAAALGCRSAGGMEMFIAQAARQFAWWTGLSAPVGDMREAAEAALARRGPGSLHSDESE